MLGTVEPKIKWLNASGAAIYRRRSGCGDVCRSKDVHASLAIETTSVVSLVLRTITNLAV